jgi:hypothetical protein
VVWGEIFTHAIEAGHVTGLKYPGFMGKAACPELQAVVVRVVVR